VYVGVVTDAAAIVSPEGIAGADCLRELQASIDGSSGELLVRDSDITAAARARQRLYQRAQIISRAWNGDVNRFQAQGLESGVLHERREGMRDWVAQYGEDAGRTAYHRMVPATRLTTPLISSCSSSYVAR
jgi:hypothetical protein